jgi:hypothetical protein
MTHFVISGYRPEDFDSSIMDEATLEGIHALNRQMDAAGIPDSPVAWAPATRCACNQLAT